jgi:hypothetical protein
MQERKALEETDDKSTLSQDSENYDKDYLDSLKPKPQDQEVVDGSYFEIKWKAYRSADKNEDDEQFDYLSEAIKNSRDNNGELSICDDQDEINTIYSELD